MKIALVARHATPLTTPVDPDSAEEAAHVHGLSRALAAQGHQVVIYARRDSRTPPNAQAVAPGITAEYIPAGPPGPVAPDQLPSYAGEIGSYLARRWERDAPDIVHAYHWTNGLAALFAAREHPVPVVQTFGSIAATARRHGITDQGTDARTRMESCIARSAAAVLASTSDEVAELSRMGIPSSRVRLVPSGVDGSQFKPAGYVAKRNRQARLLHFGSLADHQGLDTVLKALVEIPAAELVIAGGPPAEELESDLRYRQLGKLAANLGVADRVEFIGQVSIDKLPALLRSADLLISGAHYEPLGITAIRAMACGTPVVATTIGAYSDAVIDGTTGLLVPPGRPDVLARRLRDLLATPMRLAAFGIAAADRARSRYPWERVATETVAAYERCLGVPAERAAVAGSELAEPDLAEPSLTEPGLTEPGLTERDLPRQRSGRAPEVSRLRRLPADRTPKRPGQRSTTARKPVRIQPVSAVARSHAA